MTPQHTLLAEIEILLLPKTINAMGRKHWIFKWNESKKWKLLVMEQCAFKKITGLELKRAHLELTRHSSKEPDFDNLAQSFKHVIDGLVQANVIVDDKPSVIGSPTFKWEYAPNRKGKVTIRVFRVQDDQNKPSKA